ncbi:MAG: hypothetical protein Edafosvirus1_12 [Edafosvirus sp.]|uniref:Uncharacterized protein n=1 Tax=Edafosvirus sp. TaxID=2487765 RepID=A0A3G4ZUK8_9VIRU|nr:MAG: hypothetical protein Edafosvirus1_12 [Edafosvirus sp.]
MFEKIALKKLCEYFMTRLQRIAIKNTTIANKRVDAGKNGENFTENAMVALKIRDKLQIKKFRYKVIKKASGHFAYDKDKYDNAVLKLK